MEDTHRLTEGFGNAVAGVLSAGRAPVHRQRQASAASIGQEESGGLVERRRVVRRSCIGPSPPASRDRLALKRMQAGAGRTRSGLSRGSSEALQAPSRELLSKRDERLHVRKAGSRGHSANNTWLVQDGDGTFPADPGQLRGGGERGVGEDAGSRSAARLDGGVARGKEQRRTQVLGGVEGGRCG